MTFVAAQRDRFGVEPILRVLEIPTSTYYDWAARQRDPCQRRRGDQVLLGRIRAVHARSRGTYGAPRVHAQLRRDVASVDTAFDQCLNRHEVLQSQHAVPPPDVAIGEGTFSLVVGGLPISVFSRLLPSALTAYLALC